MTSFRFTIHGAPRTKKTHNQGVRTGARCPTCRNPRGPIRVFPSAAYRKWVKHAVIQFEPGCPPFPLPKGTPIHVTATFYRDRAIGDIVGFMQGLGDFLEDHGVITNDRDIVHWDGTRLAVDRASPRVDVTVAIQTP